MVYSPKAYPSLGLGRWVCAMLAYSDMINYVQKPGFKRDTIFRVRTQI